MSWDPETSWADGESVERPFLNFYWMSEDARWGEPVRSGGYPPGCHGEVRPYLLTGGRTRAHGPSLAVETVVLATGRSPIWLGDVASVERAGIVRLAHRPCSVAEVAAWLHLPLQVALVLVGDLVAEGQLEASYIATNPSADVSLLERLIAGVAAL